MDFSIKSRVKKLKHVLSGDHRRGKKLYNLVDHDYSLPTRGDRREQWRSVLQMAQKHPRAARWRRKRRPDWPSVKDGETALHAACRNGNAPPEVLRALLTAHPQAASWPSHNGGGTPLHALCSMSDYRSGGDDDDTPAGIFRKSLEIMLSVKEARDAIAAQDVFGRTPLHLVCLRNGPPNVVRLLLRGADESSIRGGSSALVATRDAMGNTPLHYAASRSSPNCSVKLLLEADNNRAATFGADGAVAAAATRNRSGCLPLHYACYCGVQPGVLQLLVRANPSAVMVSSAASFLIGLAVFEESPMTPLVMLSRRYTLGGAKGGTPLSSIIQLDQLVGSCAVDSLKTFWETMAMMLREMYLDGSTVDDRIGASNVSEGTLINDVRAVLYAVAATRGANMNACTDSSSQHVCPREFVDLINRVFCSLIRDAACVSEGKSGHRLLGEIAPFDRDDEKHQSMHSLSSLLAEAITIGMRWDEGLDEIWEEDPNVLYQTSRSCVHGDVLPFVVAACSPRGEVDTIYQILRRAPDTIKMNHL